MLPSSAGRKPVRVSAPPYVPPPPERPSISSSRNTPHSKLAWRRTALPVCAAEFEDYSSAGVSSTAVLRIRCDTCHAEHLVAFSCNGAAFVPAGAAARRRAPRCWSDEVFPEQPVRQWVLSVPIRCASCSPTAPDVMGRVLGIVYRCIATHLIKKAGSHENRPRPARSL